jgi:AraC family transcriptional regulator
LSYDRDIEFGLLPQIEAHHLILSPSPIGDCSLHEFRRNHALKGESDPTPLGDGLMVVLPLSALPAHRNWVNGRKVALSSSLADRFRFFDLRNSYISEVPFAFHTVHLFMPNLAFVKQAGGSPKWSWEDNGSYDDPVLHHLFKVIIPSIRNPNFKDRLFGDLVLQAAGRHIALKYANLAPVQRSFARTLSKKEESRAKEVLLDRIGGDVSVDEVATACGVSADQFSTIFKWSTGTSPHRWLVLQRIERAKSLLRSSDGSLVDIALACGFANQSDFTRVFSREVGLSPTQWRRRGNA